MKAAEASIADFRHSLEVQISEAYAVSAEHCGLISLWECRNYWASRTWIYARYEVERPDSWTMHFEQKDESYNDWEWHGEVRFDLGTTYTVAEHRAGKFCRLKVSMPESLESPLEDSGNILCADTPYQEVRVRSTLRTAYNRENWSSGFIDKLYLD